MKTKLYERVRWRVDRIMRRSLGLQGLAWGWQLGRVRMAPIKKSESRGVLYTRANPGAGMGHQLSALFAASEWANQLNLELRLVGSLCGDAETIFDLSALRAKKLPSRPRLVKIPARGDERTGEGITVLRRRIATAREHGACGFVLALDQPWFDHSGAEDFFNQLLRPGRTSTRDGTRPLVVVHVRRGDVSEQTLVEGDPSIRGLPLAWYAGIVSALQKSPGFSSAHYVAITSGTEEDVDRLKRLSVDIRTGGSVQTDFNLMLDADVLVTSPSSFSMVAGMSTGHRAVIYRKPWWHELPGTAGWFALYDERDFAALERWEER